MKSISFVLFLLFFGELPGQTGFPYDSLFILKHISDSIYKLSLPPMKEQIKWNPYYAAVNRMLVPGKTYSIELTTSQAATGIQAPAYEVDGDEYGYYITSRRHHRLMSSVAFKMQLGNGKNTTNKKVIEAIEDIGYGKRMIFSFQLLTDANSKPAITVFNNDQFSLQVKGISASILSNTQSTSSKITKADGQ